MDRQSISAPTMPGLQAFIRSSMTRLLVLILTRLVGQPNRNLGITDVLQVVLIGRPDANPTEPGSEISMRPARPWPISVV